MASPAGTYANEIVGISCTGIGENIISVSLASNIGIRSLDMAVKEAIERAFADLDRISGKAAIIALDSEGNFYHRQNTERLSYAFANAESVEAH